MATALKFDAGKVKLTLKNIYKADNAKFVENINEVGDEIINETGLAAMAGEPAVKDNEKAFVAAHDAQILLFKSNQRVILKPEDTLEIVPQTTAEYLYYLGLGSEFLEVKESAVA